MMMYSLTVRCLCGCLSLLLLLQTAHAWYYAGRAEDNEIEMEEEMRLINMLKDVKRTEWTNTWCGKWHTPCVPNQDTCCAGYTCKCNLWQSNCSCRGKLFG